MNEAALPRRIALIDAWRGVALVAMMTFHGAWDLAYLHLARIDPSGSMPWRIYAHVIAGTFLFLAGVSLVLATRSGFRLEPYLRRLGMIVAGAALSRSATYFAMPQGWVYFAASCTRSRWQASSPCPSFACHRSDARRCGDRRRPAAGLRSEFFDVRRCVDRPRAAAAQFLRLCAGLPVDAAVLAGVAAGRLAVSHGLDRRLAAAWQPKAWLGRLLAFAGRHSLSPSISSTSRSLRALFLVAQVLVPDAAVDGARADCVDRCVAARADEVGCHAYCRCMFEDMDKAGSCADARQRADAGRHGPRARHGAHLHRDDAADAGARDGPRRWARRDAASLGIAPSIHPRHARDRTRPRRLLAALRKTHPGSDKGRSPTRLTDRSHPS